MKKILLCLSAAALILGACGGKKDKKEVKAIIPQVKVAVATKAMVEQRTEFSGNIEPFVRNAISSGAAQRIEKIYVEVGSMVKKGQLLVQMENTGLEQSNAQLQNLKSDLSRIEALFNAGGISRQQYEQMKTQVKVAQESYGSLSKNTRLTSPISGVVTQKNFNNGDLAQGQPILVVMQLHPVKIIINISEEFFPKVKPGTAVELFVDIYPDRSFPGKVSSVYPTIDPATRTFQAEVKIENEKMDLRPGMFAKVRVDFGKSERVVVPDVAIVRQSGTNDKYVYKLEGDKVKYVKVELGARTGSDYVILSGVSDGDRIVVAGQNNLVNDTQVKVREK